MVEVQTGGQRQKELIDQTKRMDSPFWWEKWTEALTGEAKDAYQRMITSWFKDTLDQGYQVLKEIPADNSSLLQSGTTDRVERVQREVAEEKIGELKWIDKTLGRPERDLVWKPGAVAPKNHWDGSSPVNPNQLSYQAGGITIFEKVKS